MNERTRLKPLLGYVVILQVLLYPVILCWAWNINGDGGFLRKLGYFDRGGAVVIFLSGALAGVLGAVILGPRYGLFMRKKNDETPLPTLQSGGSVERVDLTQRKSLGTLLEEVLDETVDVDDMFLSRIRRLIKADNLDTNFYYMVDVPGMVLGTFLAVIGFTMLNTCGAGNHSLNSEGGRYAAEISMLNTFVSGSVCSFLCFLLKRHIVVGDHWLTPRYDIRSLCNGYLSGMTAVAAGAGAMKPWGALITGTVQAFTYMISCLIMQRVKFDDAMENWQTFGTASFTAMFAAVFFLPDQGVLWSSTSSGSILGV